MQSFNTLSLKVTNNQLWILDQQALPQETVWHPSPDVAALVEHIRTLRVRGALLAENGMPVTALEQALETMRTGKGMWSRSGWMKRAPYYRGRLTAWELGELNIPYRLICDSMAATTMAQGHVDAVWVGADRIAANGDIANKIGTYSLAVLARYHGIPFYVAAPHTTHDAACPDGKAIPIEQRAASEVSGVAGSFGTCQWAPQDAQVYNPAFDVTPVLLISGWVLDSGVITPEQVQAGDLHSGLALIPFLQPLAGGNIGTTMPASDKHRQWHRR